MNELQDIFRTIKEIASKVEQVECIKLFGSRARGDHSERSDIDLAVFGENIGEEELTYQLETEVWTLLEFDISYMENIEDEVFREQVEKEGIIIYEKYRL